VHTLVEKLAEEVDTAYGSIQELRLGVLPRDGGGLGLPSHERIRRVVAFPHLTRNKMSKPRRQRFQISPFEASSILAIPSDPTMGVVKGSLYVVG
jgi:hypothetical protein